MRTPIELKIKASSLAAEARIIRKLEIRRRQQASKRRKLKLPFDITEAERLRIHEHRIKVVRPEARATHLVRAYMAGYEYGRIEKMARTAPWWLRMREIAYRYGGQMKDYDAWVERAQEYYKAKEKPVIAVERREIPKWLLQRDNVITLRAAPPPRRSIWQRLKQAFSLI